MMPCGLPADRCRVELSGQPPLDKLKAELVVQEHWQEAQVRKGLHKKWVRSIFLYPQHFVDVVHALSWPYGFVLNARKV